MRKLLLFIFLVATVSACAGILGLRKSGGQQPFEHRAHVLEGVSCVRCHPGIERAGESGPAHLPGAGTCLECHEEPHDRRECGQCHGLPGTRQAARQAREHLRFRHDTHLGRTGGGCTRCHSEIGGDAITLRPKMATCLGCHAHRDQFETRECDACHENLRTEHTRPQSHLVHEGDFVREHGARAASAGDLCASCHKETFCASCHGASVPALPERMAFDDPGRPGVHRAGFRSRHAEEASADPGLCTTCHTERSCRRCHSRRGVAAGGFGAASPHPAGWLGLPGERNDHGRAAWRDPASCSSCHGGAGEALCVGCHRVGGIGGDPHPPGWSSTRSRAELPCRLCHQGVL